MENGDIIIIIIIINVRLSRAVTCRGGRGQSGCCHGNEGTRAAAHVFIDKDD